MKLSIVIPTLNRENVIGRAIKSVLSQSYKNFELIIIDDGSRDKTSEIVVRFKEKDKRIKYIKLNKNKGFYAAKNRGIKLTKGDWACFLDSDDEYLPNALKIITSELLKLEKNIGIAHFMITTKKPDGLLEKLGYCPSNLKWKYYYPTYQDIVLKKNLHGDMHRCIRTKIAKKNLFSKDNPGLETLYYANLAKKGIESVYVNKNIVQVNEDCQHRHSLIRFQKWPRKFAQAYIELIKQHSPVFQKQRQKLFDHYITIAKCYFSAKNPLAIWWLTKALLLKPKKFLRGTMKCSLGIAFKNNV